MRYITLLTLSILTLQLSHAQINEIGGFAGGSNFIGDVGATNYIAPNSPTLGILYKWNRSPRYAWRISIIYSDLVADDSKSDDSRRVGRKYYLDSNLLEFSAGMEFTFMDFDLHSGRTMGTPYLYTGITTARHDNYYFSDTGEQTPEDNSSWAYGIPITLGYKTNILGRFILGAEIGARYTFSDDIDGNQLNKAVEGAVEFGNINNNDWYVFSGFTLTYTFGQKPCYCTN